MLQETVEPVAEPAPVVDCHAFLIKLQQKGVLLYNLCAVTVTAVQFDKMNNIMACSSYLPCSLLAF